jgi:hypothetical protein
LLAIHLDSGFYCKTSSYRRPSVLTTMTPRSAKEPPSSVLASGSSPRPGESEKYGAWRNEIEKLACPRRAEMFERVRPARLTDGRRRDGKKDDRADS